MTAKELVLVVGIAGFVGAGAAVAATSLHEPPAPAVDPAELAAQLARLDAQLERTDAAQKAAQEAIAKLTERVTGLQIDVNGAREELRTRERIAAQGTDTGDDAVHELGDLLKAGLAGRLREGDRGDDPARPGIRIGGLDAAVLRNRVADVAKRLEGLAPGLALRMLPEAERWDKAKAELGLQDAQVETLKRAVADRDAALKDAMQVETSDTEQDGTTIRIRRMDPVRAAAAQQDYDRKLSEVLDTDQRKKWDEKGYGHAFGGPSGGNTVAVFANTIEMTEEPPPAERR